LLCFFLVVVALITATNAVSYPNPFNSQNETGGSIIGQVNYLSPPMADITNVITAASSCDATSMPAIRSTVMAIYNVSGQKLRNNKVQMSGANGQETQANAMAAIFANAVSSTNFYISAGPTINPLETSVQEVTPVAEIAVKSVETFSFRPLSNDVLAINVSPQVLVPQVTDRTIQDTAGKKDYPNPFS